MRTTVHVRNKKLNFRFVQNGYFIFISVRLHLLVGNCLWAHSGAWQLSQTEKERMPHSFTLTEFRTGHSFPWPQLTAQKTLQINYFCTIIRHLIEQPRRSALIHGASNREKKTGIEQKPIINLPIPSFRHCDQTGNFLVSPPMSSLASFNSHKTCAHSHHYINLLPRFLFETKQARSVATPRLHSRQFHLSFILSVRHEWIPNNKSFVHACARVWVNCSRAVLVLIFCSCEPASSTHNS